MLLVQLRPQQVEYMPPDDQLVGGVLYISLPFEVAIHLCGCGCGTKVVTPLGTGGWTLTDHGDGEFSLSPSVGNFQIPCKSHYWIKRNQVRSA